MWWKINGAMRTDVVSLLADVSLPRDIRYVPIRRGLVELWQGHRLPSEG